MTTKVFVYGSLKRGYWNNRLLMGSKFIGTGSTNDAEFRMYDGTFPYVTTEGIDDVQGEVWEVDEATLRNLDALEGTPDHYVRYNTKVYMDEEDVSYDVVMYVASEETEKWLNRSGYLVIEPNEWGVLVWGDDRDE